MEIIINYNSIRIWNIDISRYVCLSFIFHWLPMIINIYTCSRCIYITSLRRTTHMYFWLILDLICVLNVLCCFSQSRYVTHLLVLFLRHMLVSDYNCNRSNIAISIVLDWWFLFNIDVLQFVVFFARFVLQLII